MSPASQLPSASASGSASRSRSSASSTSSRARANCASATRFWIWKYVSPVRSSQACARSPSRSASSRSPRRYLMSASGKVASAWWRLLPSSARATSSVRAAPRRREVADVVEEESHPQMPGDAKRPVVDLLGDRDRPIRGPRAPRRHRPRSPFTEANADPPGSAASARRASTASCSASSMRSSARTGRPCR